MRISDWSSDVCSSDLKNLTLDYGRALRQALEATGRYRAVMTRERDVFLKLRERIALAQRAEGDLFISLHSTVHSSGSVRGASIRSDERRGGKECVRPCS